MSPTGMIVSFLAFFLAIFALSVVFGSFFTVETAQVAIVQRLGKFARVAGPGLNWKTPLIEAVVQRMSMKVQQFDVKVETKTQDNVFVQIPVSIQYKVIPESVEAAFYKHGVAGTSWSCNTGAPDALRNHCTSGGHFSSALAASSCEARTSLSA